MGYSRRPDQEPLDQPPPQPSPKSVLWDSASEELSPVGRQVRVFTVSSFPLPSAIYLGAITAMGRAAMSDEVQTQKDPKEGVVFR